MDNEKIDENMARDARNAYARKWRLENKDKVKAANMRYWAKRAMQQKEAGSKTEISGESEGKSNGHNQ